MVLSCLSGLDSMCDVISVLGNITKPGSNSLISCGGSVT